MKHIPYYQAFGYNSRALEKPNQGEREEKETWLYQIQDTTKRKYSERVKMQEVNWGNYKAKFNGKEQKIFEWLCYLLFCDEFNKPTGIFRYKNQAGIETEPILVNDEWVGFQAKFYESKIGEKKNDVQDSIKKAKEKNPNLNKILFYTNQDLSENNKKGEKEPKYKTDIENHAKSLNVTIEWRTSSYFESPHVCIKNATLASQLF